LVHEVHWAVYDEKHWEKLDALLEEVALTTDIPLTQQQTP